jgi:hypothetical protein
MGWIATGYGPTNSGAAIGAVTGHFSSMMSFASGAYSTALGLIGEMSSIADVSFDGSVDVPDVLIEIGDFSPPDKPGDISTQYTAPSTPSYDSMDAVSIDISGVFPTLSVGAPVLSLGDEPNPLGGESIPSTPSISYPNFPGRPNYSLPNPPSIHDIQIPSPPSVDVGEFSEIITLPVIPEPTPAYYESSQYSSPIYEAMISWVLDGIRDGGTGLGPDVEDAIWRRAQDRVAAENEDALINTLAFFESRGWDLPPGALQGAVLEITNQNTRNLTQVSDDIAIAEAKLAQENTHFVLTLSKDLEGMLRTFFIENENRILQAAIAIAQNAVEVYKAKIQKLGFDVEVYRVKAEVYKTRIEAALARVEVFKAQVEAAKVSAEVQQLLVQIYTAQLQAVNVIADIYKTDMQAAAIQVDAEKLKIDIFRSQIEAYAATINAKTAEWEGYKARMQGEAVKASIYETQVKAYGIQVDATSSEMQARVEVAKAQIEYQKARIANNSNLVEQYKAEIQGAIAQVESATDIYKAEASMYEAEGKVLVSQYSAQTELVQARVAAAKLQVDAAIAELDAQVKSFVAIQGIRMEGVKGAAAVAAQLAAGAMSAVHASAAIGYNGSDNNAFSSSLAAQQVAYSAVTHNTNINKNG